MQDSWPSTSAEVVELLGRKPYTSAPQVAEPELCAALGVFLPMREASLVHRGPDDNLEGPRSSQMFAGHS